MSLSPQMRTKEEILESEKLLLKEVKRLNDYNKQFIKEIFDLEQRLVNKTRHIEELYETIAILKREL